MIEIAIPGFTVLKLRHLVLDYNGTLACDGELLPGVAAALNDLAGSIEVHVVTADTFGTSRAALRGVTCTLTVLPPAGQDQAKLAYVERLGGDQTVCIGNGRNDRMMLKAAALELLVHPLRLIATLRA